MWLETVLAGGGRPKGAAVDLRELVARGVSEGKSQREIAAEAGVSQPRVAKIIKELKAQGKIHDGDDGASENLHNLLYKARYTKAKTEHMEARAERERLGVQELRGQLIRRAAVEEVLVSLRARLKRASERIKRLPAGRDAILILQECMRGIDGEVDRAVEATQK